MFRNPQKDEKATKRESERERERERKGFVQKRKSIPRRERIGEERRGEKGQTSLWIDNLLWRQGRKRASEKQ